MSRNLTLEDPQPFATRLPRSLQNAVRQYALDLSIRTGRKTSIQEIVKEAIIQYLEEQGVDYQEK